jgi:hypothetical protein
VNRSIESRNLAAATVQRPSKAPRGETALKDQSYGSSDARAAG